MDLLQDVAQGCSTLSGLMSMIASDRAFVNLYARFFCPLLSLTASREFLCTCYDMGAEVIGTVKVDAAHAFVSAGYTVRFCHK